MSVRIWLLFLTAIKYGYLDTFSWKKGNIFLVHVSESDKERSLILFNLDRNPFLPDSYIWNSNIKWKENFTFFVLGNENLLVIPGTPFLTQTESVFPETLIPWVFCWFSFGYEALRYVRFTPKINERDGCHETHTARAAYFRSHGMELGPPEKPWIIP